MIIYITRSLWLHSLCTWYQKYLYLKLGVVVHICNPSTWLEEAEKIRRSRPTLMKTQVWGQPGLYETLLQKKWNKAKWSQTLVFGLGDVTLGGKSRTLHTQNLEFVSSALQKQSKHIYRALKMSKPCPWALPTNYPVQSNQTTEVNSVLFPLYCWTNRLRQVSQHVGSQQAKWQSGAWLTSLLLHLRPGLHCACHSDFLWKFRS